MQNFTFSPARQDSAEEIAVAALDRAVLLGVRDVVSFVERLAAQFSDRRSIRRADYASVRDLVGRYGQSRQLTGDMLPAERETLARVWRAANQIAVSGATSVR